jgi:hypothetical protein
VKFDCGETPEARAARVRAESQEWHDVFAWWPVRVGPRECAWLEVVQQRFVPHNRTCSLPGCDLGEWEFRARAASA